MLIVLVYSGLIEISKIYKNLKRTYEEIILFVCNYVG